MPLLPHDRGPEGSGLKRALGLPTAILLVAGSMIGSGVFKKIAPMSKALGDENTILLAWLLAGVITLFGAFTYAGLSSLTTGAGGLYEYLRIAFGKFTAFLFGWTTFTVIGSGSIAAVAYVFAQSFSGLAPLPASGVTSLAIGMIWLLTALNVFGVKNSGQFSNLLTAVKVAGILALIVLGLTWHQAAEAPGPNPVPQASTGISALLTAMLSAFWAFDGWANLTYITGEVRDPGRNIPLAVTGGVGLTLVLYLLLNYSYMQVIPVSGLAAIGQNHIAAAEVSRTLLGDSGTRAFSLLIMCSTLGALHANILSYPRIYFRMAQEKVFFQQAAKVHPRYQTPYISLILSAGWSSLLLFSGTFDQLTDLVIFAVFLFFAMGALALVKMKRAGVIKGKVTGYPLVPYLILIFCAGFFINNVIARPFAAAAALALIALGILFYSYFMRKG